MKKLTKRNRTHNRKAVFGYSVECGPGQMSGYTTALTRTRGGGWTLICKYAGEGHCCDVE